MDLKYYGLCLGIALTRFIPVRVGYFLADRGGDVFFLLSPGRRKNVTNNIQCAMGPDKSQEKVRQKVRLVFRNAAKNYFDLTKLAKIRFEKLEGKAKIEGMQHLTQAVKSGKGVIIATAHLGNFEFGAHLLASRGIEMLIFVEDFDSAPFLQKLAALRKGKGVKVAAVDMRGVKEGMQTLRRGGVVTIVCDRDFKGNGIKVNFLGQESSFPVGVVDLAMRTGALIVPVFSLRQPDNTTLMLIEPPLILADNQNRDEALKANLTGLVAILERYIAKYPEQWVILEPK